MEVKEYLNQAYRLDQRINSDIKEVEALRDMACGVSSIALGERVQTSKSGQAPFVKTVEKIIDFEKKIDAEIDLLVDLKVQMRSAVEEIENPDEKMVLKYRYVHEMTWNEIGSELNIDARTARRWHDEAIKKVKIPENFIKI